MFRQLYSEKKVVLEERRMRVDNAPLGRFQEAFGLASLTNNYRRPVIGYEVGDVKHRFANSCQHPAVLANGHGQLGKLRQTICRFIYWWIRGVPCDRPTSERWAVRRCLPSLRHTTTRGR